MRRAVFLLVCVGILSVSISAQTQNQERRLRGGSSRAAITSIEPEGFLGIRFGNSLRFAEDLFGEPNVKRSGSLEWHFRGGDYDPFEALTILSDGRKINGFVAHLHTDRIHFSDLNLMPVPNKFGTFFATRAYMSGDTRVEMLAVGDNAEYIRRITLVAKDKAKQ